MKIRQGFVSNSSSSSFHMYGVSLDMVDLEELLLEKELISKEELEQDGSSETIEAADIMGLDARVYFDAGVVYVGRYYSSIGDEETGGKFKESIETQVEKLFGEKKECQEIEEVIYNG
jgi:hypothetical protein